MSRRALPLRGVYGCLLLLSAAAIGCDDDTKDTRSGDDAAAAEGNASAGGKAGSSSDDKGKGGSGGAGGSKSTTSGQTAAGGQGGSSSDDGDKDEAGGKGGAGGAGGKAAADSGGSGGAGGAGGAGGSGGAGGAGGEPAKDIVRPDLSNATATLYNKINALNGLVYGDDGKIYAAGEVNVVDESKGTGDTPDAKYKTSVVGHKLVVARFSADGAPDESFGDKGFVTWEGPAGEATAIGLTLAGEDKDQVVVSANIKYASKRGGVALVKLDKDGKLVEGFGDKGRKDLILGWTDDQVADFPKAADGTIAFPTAQSWDVKTAEDGDLVVFLHESAAHGQLDDSKNPPVQRGDNDRYIVRVKADTGELDSEWNGGKPVVVNTPNEGFTLSQPKFPSDGARRGIIEADGSIVAVGYTGYGDDKGNQIVMIKVKPDGSFDEAFHKERPNQPVLPGVAVFDPFPDEDKGFAECYGVAKTDKGYVTTGYGMAYGVMGATGKSSLGYLPSVAVDMVSTRFTGTEVDKTYGKSGVLAAQSEGLGTDAIATFEDRGRSPVIELPDHRLLMAGRFGDYASLFVVTENGELDTRIKGKRSETDGRYLFPTLKSDKQPSTSLIYGLAASKDGKRVAIGTNNHEQGAYFSVLEVKDDGTFAPVK